LERDSKRRAWNFYCLAIAAFTLLAIPIKAGVANNEDTARAPIIAIVNFQKVTRESKAGASLREQVDKMHAIFQEEIKLLQTELETGRQNLRKRQNSENSNNFKRLNADYRHKAEKLQKLAQERKRQLDQIFVNGMRRIETELANILEKIAHERGIDIILNTARGQGVVMYAKPSTLISKVAKSILDERLPNLTVSLPKKLTPKKQ